MLANLVAVKARNQCFTALHAIIFGGRSGAESPSLRFTLNEVGITGKRDALWSLIFLLKKYCLMAPVMAFWTINVQTWPWRPWDTLREWIRGMLV